MRRFHHGTNKIIHAIDLSLCRSRTDFGKGFYMGNNLGEARRVDEPERNPGSESRRNREPRNQGDRTHRLC